ncbi:MAG: copper amine oxidase N-terminal domain-containing protein [Thermotaleaceae bacterium]
MDKRKLVFMVLMATIFMLPLFSLAEGSDHIQVSINNRYLDFNEDTGYPFIDTNNRVQVPFRVTLEAFGAQVEWREETKSIVTEKNGIKVELPINESYILVDGKTIDNDSPCLVKNGRVYLPIRVILEQFGSKVIWDNQSKTVYITYDDVDGNSEKIQDVPPQVEIKSPRSTVEKQAAIKIITDKENSIYLNGHIIKLDANNEYIVDLPNITNEFKIEVVNPQAAKTTKTFIIEKVIDELYLNVKAENTTPKEDKVLIVGDTNPGNTVKINGKEISVNEKGKFEYWFSGLEPNKNVINIIAASNKFDKKIENKINVYYKNSKVEEDFYGSSKPEEETEYENPIVYLDEEIPEVTNKASFTVSGTCENTEYITIQSPLNFNTKTAPINNRFSITVKLITNDEHARKEKGIGNVVTIIAKNGDKILVKEYVVYYNGGDQRGEDSDVNKIEE